MDPAVTPEACFVLFKERLAEEIKQYDGKELEDAERAKIRKYLLKALHTEFYAMNLADPNYANRFYKLCSLEFHPDKVETRPNNEVMQWYSNALGASECFNCLQPAYDKRESSEFLSEANPEIDPELFWEQLRGECEEFFNPEHQPRFYKHTIAPYVSKGTLAGAILAVNQAEQFSGTLSLKNEQIVARSLLASSTFSTLVLMLNTPLYGELLLTAALTDLLLSNKKTKVLRHIGEAGQSFWALHNDLMMGMVGYAMSLQYLILNSSNTSVNYLAAVRDSLLVMIQSSYSGSPNTQTESIARLTYPEKDISPDAFTNPLLKAIASDIKAYKTRVEQQWLAGYRRGNHKVIMFTFVLTQALDLDKIENQADINQQLEPLFEKLKDAHDMNVGEASHVISRILDRVAESDWTLQQTQPSKQVYAPI